MYIMRNDEIRTKKILKLAETLPSFDVADLVSYVGIHLSNRGGGD